MKNTKALKKWLRDQIVEIEDDDRFQAPPANVEIKAPLALIQVDLKARLSAYRQTFAKIEEAE